MSDQTKKPRARRISSAEALAWALNLRLRNTTAKFILCALSQYVDGDGICFVGIGSIAEDTELSDQTIRSRLAWLEEVGVIARTPQYVDEFGNRNSVGKGRRTSDNIRLMVALNQDQIEERAESKSRKTHSNLDPQNQADDEVDPQNLTVSADEDAPQLPSRLPSTLPSSCAEGLISEPEPEPSPPKSPPPGDLNEDETCEEGEAISEPEHFAEFWQSYPGHEVMSRWRALEIFVTMKPDERAHARAAALAHADVLKKMKRRPKDAHKWLAERGWQEYPNAKLAVERQASAKRLIHGTELAVVRLAIKIAGLADVPIIATRISAEWLQTQDSTFWKRPIEADLLSLEAFIDQDAQGWLEAHEGTPQFTRWRDRLREWVGGAQPQKIWLEPFNPDVHGRQGSDPAFKPRKFVLGFRVPTEWPPRKTPTSESESDAPETLMSEQDMADFN